MVSAFGFNPNDPNSTPGRRFFIFLNIYILIFYFLIKFILNLTYKNYNFSFILLNIIILKNIIKN